MTRKLFIAILGFLLLVSLSVLIKQEAFTSPGTLVQLTTSHVPTDADILVATDYYKQAKQDLRDMTGSD